MTTPPNDLERHVRIALVLAASAAVLGTVRWHLGGVPLGDDISSHHAEALHVARAIRGQASLWFEGANLGYPLFTAYQPLPALLTGLGYVLMGSFIDELALFKLLLTALWAVTPLAWYVGGRGLGLDPRRALWLGLLVPLLADAHHFGLGPDAVASKGLATQTWAMVPLPLALGAIWTHLEHEDRPVAGALWPGLLLALTTLCHVYLGWITAIAAGAMALADPRDIVRRATRLAAVGLFAVFWVSPWLLPFLTLMPNQGGLAFKAATESGAGLQATVIQLLGGASLDHGRTIPVLTLAAAAGLIRAGRGALARRWAVLYGGICVLLFLGPNVWGDLYRHLPLHEELQVVRYLGAIQIAAVVLAAAAVQDGLDALPKRVVPAATGIVAVLLCGAQAWNLSSILRTEPRAPLVELANALGPGTGRLLAHKDLGTPSHLHMNLLPALAERPGALSFSRGYHDTLSLYHLEVMGRDPHLFPLFHISHALARGTLAPEGCSPVVQQGSLTLCSLDDAAPGPFQMIRIPASLMGPSHKALRPPIEALTPRLYRAGALVALCAEDCQGPRALWADEQLWWADEANEAPVPLTPAEVAARVIERSSGRAASHVIAQDTLDGSYSARVQVLDPRDRLLFSMSHHPWWHATVDEVEVPIQPVAPSLMAIELPLGEHEVTFRYRWPAAVVVHHAVWLVFLALALWWRRRQRAGARPPKGDVEPIA